MIHHRSTFLFRALFSFASFFYSSHLFSGTNSISSNVPFLGISKDVSAFSGIWMFIEHNVEQLKNPNAVKWDDMVVELSRELRSIYRNLHIRGEELGTQKELENSIFIPSMVIEIFENILASKGYEKKINGSQVKKVALFRRNAFEKVEGLKLLSCIKDLEVMLFEGALIENIPGMTPEEENFLKKFFISINAFTEILLPEYEKNKRRVVFEIASDAFEKNQKNVAKKVINLLIETPENNEFRSGLAEIIDQIVNNLFNNEQTGYPYIEEVKFLATDPFSYQYGAAGYSSQELIDSSLGFGGATVVLGEKNDSQIPPQALGYDQPSDYSDNSANSTPIQQKVLDLSISLRSEDSDYFTPDSSPNNSVIERNKVITNELQASDRENYAKEIIELPLIVNNFVKGQDENTLISDLQKFIDQQQRQFNAGKLGIYISFYKYLMQEASDLHQPTFTLQNEKELNAHKICSSVFGVLSVLYAGKDENAESTIESLSQTSLNKGNKENIIFDGDFYKKNVKGIVWSLCKYLGKDKDQEQINFINDPFYLVPEKFQKEEKNNQVLPSSNKQDADLSSQPSFQSSVIEEKESERNVSFKGVIPSFTYKKWNEKYPHIGDGLVGAQPLPSRSSKISSSREVVISNNDNQLSRYVWQPSWDKNEGVINEIPEVSNNNNKIPIPQASVKPAYTWKINLSPLKNIVKGAINWLKGI